MSSKAFTLIELLVVISILGLLSSLVLLSLQGAKDQAELAEAQSFARQVRTSLGLGLVGEWKFDDENDPTRDSSGYDNSGDLVNGPIWTNGVFGKSLEFDGTSDHISFAANANALDITGDISVSLWFYPNDLDSILIDNRYNFSGNEYGYHLQTKADGTVLWSSHDGVTNANSACIAHSTGTITADQWNHILVTKAGDSTTVYFYINSAAAGTDTIQRPAIAYSASFTTRYIGTSRDSYPYSDSYEFGSRRYVDGIIDEVQVYDQVFSLVEVQQLYAQGATKYSIVLK